MRDVPSPFLVEEMEAQSSCLLKLQNQSFVLVSFLKILGYNSTRSLCLIEATGSSSRSLMLTPTCWATDTCKTMVKVQPVRTDSAEMIVNSWQNDCTAWWLSLQELPYASSTCFVAAYLTPPYLEIFRFPHSLGGRKHHWNSRLL